MSSDSDTSPGLLDQAQTTPVTVKTSGSSTTVTLDVYANRPTPASAGAGSMFYATDQVALYLSNGTTWLRVGPSQTGDIIWTAEATARSGYVLLTGQLWPSTSGIYTELYNLWGGTNLPDVQARMFVPLGTHADVSTLFNNEGVATVANRRPKHKTTNALTASHTLTLPDHVHGVTDAFQVLTGPGGGNLIAGATGSSAGNYAGFGAASNTNNPTSHPSITGGVSIGGSIGTNVSTDATDQPAFIVLQPQAKL